MKKQVLMTPDEVKAWFEESNSDVYSFDWETTGLNYLEMEPVGISFCDGERACYCDCWENEDANSIFNCLSNIFSSGSFIAHHAKYDFKCCKKFLSVEPCSLFCTFIASFLLDENRDSHSLKALANTVLAVPQSRISQWEEAESYGRHSEEFYEYAMNDSIWAYQLWEIFQPQIKEEGLEHIFQIELNFIPVAAEMEMNGILVDQTKLKALEIKIANKMESLEDSMLELIDKKADIQTGIFGQGFRRLPVNFNSGQQLVNCCKKLGLKLEEKTAKKKELTVNALTLQRLKGHPFIDSLAEYKRLQKLQSAYVSPAWDQIDEDGRIRPSFGIVKTGRTNCYDPNLQQLPNVKDPEINYREIFTTDNILVGADYSGQELRILGEVSQDERIINAFKRNLDLHLLTANHIFQLGLDEDTLMDGSEAHSKAASKFKSERYRAKNGANFPIVYGSTAAGIAWRQGVSKEEAQRWVDGFFKAYPGVKVSMDRIPRELKNKGYLSTLMGRRRRFPDYDVLPQHAGGKYPCKDRCVRQGFNFWIQGFAADQAKIAGRKIYDEFKKHPNWGARMLMIVHDEYVCECKEKYLNEVKKCITNCMENAVSLSIPFKVDCKSGKTYSEIK